MRSRSPDSELDHDMKPQKVTFDSNNRNHSQNSQNFTYHVQQLGQESPPSGIRKPNKGKLANAFEKRKKAKAELKGR